MKKKWTNVSVKLTEKQKLEVQKLFEDWKVLYGEKYLHKHRKYPALSSFLLNVVISTYGANFYKKHKEQNEHEIKNNDTN